jgi:disease resistance protein RPM1
MAEMAVSLVVDQLLPLLREEAKLLRGVHKEFAEIKDELESIQAFLKDADKRAAGAEGDNTNEGVKIWVKQLREAAFRIEDIIDEYLILAAQQPRDHGCIALLHKLKTMIPRVEQHLRFKMLSHLFVRSQKEVKDMASNVRLNKE